MAKLSVVIPVYNEEVCIPELHRRLTESLQRDFQGFEYELIFVDDGSRDGSMKLLLDLKARDTRVKVIEFSRNFGHHIAITAGLDYASGDYVVMMDGDLQDKPEEVIKLYQKLYEGFDVVYGERIDKKFSLMKRLNSAVFNWAIRRLIDEPIVINSTIFRIMTKQVVQSMKLLRERNRYVVGVVGWVGFKHAGQPVDHGERFAGETKYHLRQQLTLALNAACSYSTHTLTLITRIGFGFVIASVLLVASILLRKILYNTPVMGWTSLVFMILAVGGMQIIMLGMIGEYVGRNFIEGKNRPLYIIRRVYD